MTEKTIPLSEDNLEQLTNQYPTPFHLYDEKAIRTNARRLKKAFAWNPGFHEYFAVKAAPNPFLMKILKTEGFGCDCSSSPELMLSESVGIIGEEIMFTSNDTPESEFKKALELGAIINLDDLSHLETLEKAGGMPELICFRYNPGALKAGNTIIGHPEEAKYGLTRDQIFEAYQLAKRLGAKRFGIHTMVASNELNKRYFAETAQLLFDLVIEIAEELDITFEFVNLGGGIGIPYKPDEEPVDLETLGTEIEQIYNTHLLQRGHPPLKLYLECGRMVTGPYGWLVSRVRHMKHTYKDFVGLDACMSDLMRPALYEAYHHISIVGKSDKPTTQCYDVTGSLCENNDKFAIDRQLPEVETGDLVVIHDTGAHGHAMGFNYNAKLRSAELLLREKGEIVQIRRPETVEDYFATLDFSKLPDFKA